MLCPLGATPGRAAHGPPRTLRAARECPGPQDAPSALAQTLTCCVISASDIFSMLQFPPLDEGV